MRDFAPIITILVNIGLIVLTASFLPSYKYLLDLRPIVFLVMSYAALHFLYPNKRTIVPLIGSSVAYLVISIISIIQYIDSPASLLGYINLPILIMCYTAFFCFFIILPTKILLEENDDDEDDEEAVSKLDSVFWAKYAGGNLAGLVLFGFMIFLNTDPESISIIPVLIFTISPTLVLAVLVREPKNVLIISSYYLLGSVFVLFLMSAAAICAALVTNNAPGSALGTALTGSALPLYLYFFFVRPLKVQLVIGVNRIMESAAVTMSFFASVITLIIVTMMF